MTEQSTASVEQAQTGTPQQTQQAAVQPLGTAPTTTTAPNPEPSAEATQEQIQQWRQQAEETQQYRQQLQQREEQYRNLQSDYTRKAQALASLSGAPPPGAPAADPLTPYVEELTSKGYEAKQARDLAGMMHRMVSPLQQQLQAGLQSAQNATMIDSTMRQAWSMDPELMSHPAVGPAIENTLRTMAAHGGTVDVQNALYAGLIARYEADRANRNRANPPQQQQPQNNFLANGMFRPTTGWTPPTQTTQLASPEQQAADDYISKRFNLQKQ